MSLAQREVWDKGPKNKEMSNKHIDIVRFDNGKILKYSQDKLEDEFGGLGEGKFDLSEFDGIECSKNEFEENWNR